MSHERIIVAAAVALLMGSVVAVVAVPGAVASLDQEPEGPGRLDVNDMAIASGEVSGETAELVVRTRLHHVGPPAENVTIEFRATDLESGLLVATTTVAVPPIEGDREVTVNGTLRVEREGGYRLEAVVYHDGRPLRRADRRVEGVGALQPAYAVSPVDFHTFRATDQPSIEYRIADTTDRTATLAVTTYLTNTGDTAAGGLRLLVKARQADSGIVADAAEVSVGTIEAGRTATPTATLTVPDGYNYYLDAQLWADGVIVGTARSAANLDPRETLAVNETTREIGLEVSDFEGEAGQPTREAEGTPAARTPGQPGFTAVLAVVGLLVAIGITRRVRG